MRGDGEGREQREFSEDKKEGWVDISVCLGACLATEWLSGTKRVR